VIGRNAELAWIESKLSEGAPLLAVVGPPGVGKSRLLAGLVERRRTLEHAWCDLGEVSTIEETCSAVARAVGFSSDRSPRPEDVRDRLVASGPLLLILDEADRAARSLAELLEGWLSHAPELQVVIGSRERLGLGDEEAISLEPLTLPNETVPFEESEAVRLWLALTHESADRLEEATRREIARLVTLLDGLPLAIALAAARHPLLLPEELRKRVERGPEVLENEGGKLREALERSWDLLDEAERMAFAHTSVFRGGFTVESAEALIAPLAGHRAPLDLVQSLFRKSLLQLRPQTKTARVCLLSTIRELAAEKLRASGLEQDARRRHARVVLDRIEREATSIDSLELADTIAWFDEEAHNVFAAIDEELAHRDSDSLTRAARVCIAASTVGAWSSFRAEISARIRTLRGELSEIDPAIAASLLLAYSFVGPSGAMRLEALTEALSLARKAQDRTLEARIGMALLPPLADEGRLDDADAMLAGTIAILESLRDPLLEAELARRRAAIPYSRGNLEQALEHARRGLELARARGSARLEYAALVTLCFASAEAGDSVRALRYGTLARQKLAPSSAVEPSRSGDASLLASQGYAHHCRAEYGEALDSYGSALERLPVAGQLTSLLRGYTAIASFQKDDRDPRDVLEAVIDELRPLAVAHAMLFQGYLAVIETIFGERRTGATLGARAREGAQSVNRVRARALAICAIASGADDAPLPPFDEAIDSGIEVGIARNLAERALSREPPVAKLAAARVAMDGTWFEVDGRRISCGHRPVMTRLLAALAHAEAPLTTDALVTRTWPGERILREPARNRVRVMIARMRDLGLRAALRGGDDGYTLDAERIVP